MLLMILTHTPLWVWALLAALVVLGLWQTRPRQVPRMRVIALPLVLLALGLFSMAPGFAAQPVAGVLWLAMLALCARAGMAAGRRSGAVWLPAERRLALPGSWVPLALVLAIFTLRYATGVALALQPAWRGMAVVQWPLALCFGALSGYFLGRALGLLGLAGAAPAITIAPHGSHPRV